MLLIMRLYSRLFIQTVCTRDLIMEWKSNIRRTQSLKSLSSSCDKPVWTDAGLRDKTTSVSQLVARYQTAVKGNKSIQGPSVDNDDRKPNQVLKEITPSRLESKETHLESLMRKNSEKEKSRAKTNLTRSKSMSSLKSSTGSIEALRALFESKASLKNNAKTSLRAADFTSSYTTDVSKMNGEVEDVQIAVEEQGMETCADKTDVKDDRVLNVGSFGLDIYLTQFIFGLVEFPARLGSLPVLQLIGRRIGQSVVLLFGGLACLGILVIPKDLPIVITVIAVLGKFSATASFSIVYVYTAELYPTNIRQNGVGLNSMLARVAGILAPLIRLLSTYHYTIPMLIYGIIPLAAGGLCLLLPETRNVELQDRAELTKLEDGAAEDGSSTKVDKMEKNTKL
ncbi:uncharacterized protein LOC120741518 [Simochromis diagramma]|uniref:uncharacterized protein LOC120741518 n=1 Tax=Simochromis diagramma TaxID=43689 RepID=UPI001A7E90A5|nr:uncharacterized protein LOC120741518 [Simochromis diagramma]